jgi:hypothetical protein
MHVSRDLSEERYVKFSVNPQQIAQLLVEVSLSTWTEIITQPSLMRLLRRYTTVVFNGCVIIYVSLLRAGRNASQTDHLRYGCDQ